MLISGFGPGSEMAPTYSGQPSPPYTMASASTFASDLFEMRPAKKQRFSAESASYGLSGDQAAPHQTQPLSQSQPVQTQTRKGAPTATKSKRVRTGCLTCRERHLKCDEATPDCMNCRKSNRECKRGVRLNFIDIQVKSPPHMPLSDEWIIHFQDESRLIASEYQGGLVRYSGTNLALAGPQGPVYTAKQGMKNPKDQQQMQHNQGAMIATLMTEGSKIPHGQIVYDRGSGYYTHKHRRTGNMLDRSHDHTSRDSEASLTGPSSSHSSAVYAGLQAGEAFAAIKGDTSRATTLKDSPVSTPGSMETHTTRPPSSTRGGPDSPQASPPGGILTPPQDSSGYTSEAEAGRSGCEVLSQQEEVEYMQAFVEEVGPWVDSMDRHSCFSNILPFRAAQSEMLMNAFLSCGVRHLTLRNLDDEMLESKALVYYNTASTLLLRNLQNPDRDTAECATTACVLNVFEIMSDKPTERMSHIAGARALIRECGWSARSEGIGAACFWLNIRMEVLSCLKFNWKCSWEPDQWGVDMDYSSTSKGISGKSGSFQDFDDDGDDVSVPGPHCDEATWVHRMFYILGRIANFRASIPRFREPCPRDEQMRLQTSYVDWNELHELCHKWNEHCPKSMKPFGYVHSAKQGGKSKFPNVWLIKRPAVVGRLFYHTAQCILAQCNPLIPRDDLQSITKATFHARQVCGIAAHCKDKGVVSVSIRSIALVSACLKDPDEQREVMSILDGIHQATGWRLGKVYTELRNVWAWENGPEGPVHSLPAAIPQVAATVPTSVPSQVSSKLATSSSPMVDSIGSFSPPMDGLPLGTGSMMKVNSFGGIDSQSPVAGLASPPKRQRTVECEREKHRQHAQVHQQHQIVAVQQLFAVSSSTPLQPPAAVAHLGVDNNNPLAAADFSLPNHPYTGFYQPPTARGFTSRASFFHA